MKKLTKNTLKYFKTNTMKAPYNLTEADFTYCPHCGEVNDDLIETEDGCTGCTMCIEKCDNCQCLTFTEEMEEIMIKRESQYVPAKICPACSMEADVKKDYVKELFDNLKPE